MALTEKQVYNLEIGDEVIVHGKCEDVYGNGDIRVNTYWTVAGEKRELCPYNKTNHENLHKLLLRIAENAKQAIVTNSIYLGK